VSPVFGPLSSTTARHARIHNDANVAIFGARTMAIEEAVARLEIFLAEPFEGGRHLARLEKIRRIENRLAGRPGKGEIGCPS
jgi:ribose 5-phosphate isomerase B